MKIADSIIQQYELPLVRPLTIGSTQITARRGLILTLRSDTELQGYGEIAPLPGLHKESLSDTIEQFIQCRGQLIGTFLSQSMLSLEGGLSQFLPLDLVPSLRSGIEMAFFDLLLQAYPIPCELPRSIPINALLMADEKNITEQIDDLLSQGFLSIKIKVARQPLEKDIQDITAILSHVHGRALLRLDANRGWTLDQAKQFCTAINCSGIEYIEEPTQNPADHIQLKSVTGIPIALDETLVSMPYQKLDPKLYHAAVIKPGVLGGLDKSASVIRWAQVHQVQPILSSDFGTDVTTRMYLLFAVMMAMTHTPLGLDTGKWYRQNLLDPPLSIEKGHLLLGSLLQRPIYKQEFLGLPEGI